MKSKRQTIKAKLRPIIESILSEAPQFPFQENDDLLRGFTFDDLITTIQSNEQRIDALAVNKVFNKLVKAALEDARYELKQNMKKIIELSSIN